MTQKPIINVNEVTFREVAHGDSFFSRNARVGPLIGSTGIGCMVYSVPPGKKAFPFHAHHQTNELFFIFEGEGTYRFGGDSYPVKAGDIIAAPAGGQETAHQIINTGNAELRYLGISDRPVSGGDVVEYPDSGKFAVTSRFDWNHPEAGGVRFVGRQADTLDYWDGEK